MLNLKERSKWVSSSDNLPLFPIPFARKLRGTTQAGGRYRVLCHRLFLRLDISPLLALTAKSLVKEIRQNTIKQG